MTQVFGELYSQSYDLLYKDKNYKLEVDYVDELIKQYNLRAETLLDLGCGSAKHDELLVNKGYKVHGVDFSQKMLDLAKKRCGDKINFTCCDINYLDLKKKFDVVTALFHVINYQNSNEKLQKSFDVVSKHLKKGGLFVFDFWYGPAVLHDLPTVREKKVENDAVKITRITEPEMISNKNIVMVNFTNIIQDKNTSKIIKVKEKHSIRYLFLPEIDAFLKGAHLTNIASYKWLTNNELGLNSWYGVIVAKK